MTPDCNKQEEDNKDLSFLQSDLFQDEINRQSYLSNQPFLLKYLEYQSQEKNKFISKYGQPQFHRKTELSFTSNSSQNSIQSSFHSEDDNNSNIKIKDFDTTETKKKPTIKERLIYVKNKNQLLRRTGFCNIDVDQQGRKTINNYLIIKELGKGAMCKVKLAKNNQNGQLCAIKIANKKKIKKKLFMQKENGLSILEQEIGIMKKLDHPNIVKLTEVIDSPQGEKLYLVMDYQQKGALMSTQYFYERWKETDPKNFLLHFNENGTLKQNMSLPNKLSIDQIQKYFVDFALALDYLHNYVGVIHRDIKPENLLISKDDNLKIGDFGVSSILQGKIDTTNQYCGTMVYMAPEIFQEQIFQQKPLDIWAAGVTIYQLTFGNLPFHSNDKQQIKQLIIEAKLQFPSPNSPQNEEAAPDSLIDLITKCLDKNPITRLKAREFLVHPFITKNGKITIRNQFQQPFSITQKEFSQAITSSIKTLHTNMKIATKLNKSLRKVRKVSTTHNITQLSIASQSPQNQDQNQPQQQQQQQKQ